MKKRERAQIGGLVAATTLAASVALAGTAAADTSSFQFDLEIKAPKKVKIVNNQEPYLATLAGVKVTLECEGYGADWEDWAPSSIAFTDVRVVQDGRVAALGRAEVYCYPETNNVRQTVKVTDWLIWEELQPGPATIETDLFIGLTRYSEETGDYSDYQSWNDTDTQDVTLKAAKTRRR